MWGPLMLWIVVAAVALAIDVVTSSFLFIWFTIGGIVAIVLSIFDVAFSIQLITFVAVSAGLMAVGYPIIKRTIKNTVPITSTMEENYIGQDFVANKDIERKATIKFEGIYWTVKNDGDFISKGDVVKIVGIEGNKLVVKKVQ